MPKQKFKTFKKKEKMKERHNMKKKISKAAGLGTRNHNRRDLDERTQSRATMEELLTDVASGSVAVSLDPMDPRALTDLLLTNKGKQDAKAKASAAPLSLKQNTPAPTARFKVAPEDEGEDDMDDEEEEDEEVELGDDEEEEDLDDEDVDEEDANRLVLDDGRIEQLPSSIPIDKLLPTGAAADDEEERLKSKNGYAKEGEDYQFWVENKLHAKIRQSLKEQHFTHPTPIQREALPTALQQPLAQDIVVSSETGSGKTLIFALPILQSILRGFNSMTNPIGIRHAGGKKGKGKRTREPEYNDDEEEGARPGYAEDGDDLPDILHALVISPTRELAQQISQCFTDLVTNVHKGGVRVGAIVGGMAQHKQQRVLNKHPHVLVCTPGRVWDLLAKNEGCFLGHSISKRLSFLVLDEADKLMQSGRFDQLKLLLDRIHSDLLPSGRSVLDTGVVHDDEEEVVGGPVELNPETGEYEPVKAPAREGEEGDEPSPKDRPRPMAVPPAPHRLHRVVTIVTSATLSLELNYSKKDVKGKRTIIRTEAASQMNKVLTALNIRIQQCAKFEVKAEQGTVAKLHETYLRCPDKSKDLYLYYFLKKYKERTIIFVNAISMLRRLTKLLEILGVPCSALHASMQQRQRLAYIDKFKTGERRVLIATDVAARGLDVEGVRYVVHYQLPRSTDSYIHRCGRTARCGGTGFSMTMVDPKEWAAFQKLLSSMGRTQAMEVFALEPVILHHLHPHIQMAMQIDKLQLELGKQSAQQRWVKTSAEEADIDADDMIKEDFDQESREKMKAVKILKKRLAAMTRRDLDIGHKGSFRSAPKALGAVEATKKMTNRADRQLYKE